MSSDLKQRFNRTFGQYSPDRVWAGDYVEQHASSEGGKMDLFNVTTEHLFGRRGSTPQDSLHEVPVDVGLTLAAWACTERVDDVLAGVGGRVRYARPPTRAVAEVIPRLGAVLFDGWRPERCVTNVHETGGFMHVDPGNWNLFELFVAFRGAGRACALYWADEIP